MKDEESTEHGQDEGTPTAVRWWKTVEVCEALGVAYGRLMALSRSPRNRGEVSPQFDRGLLRWSDAEVERMRRRIREREEQAARGNTLRGLRTSEVAASVGLPASKVLDLVRRNGIEVSRSGQLLDWDEEPIARLRALLAKRGGEEKKAPSGGERAAELTGSEVAKRLGITSQHLYRLVRAHSVPLRREEKRILWDEAAVSTAGELLRQEDSRRASEKQKTEARAELKELVTPAVCRKLGIDSATLLGLIRPFRNDLKLSQRGRLLVWTPEAVARVEEALQDRRHKADRDLLPRVEQMKLQLRKQLGALEEMVKELSTLPAITSFISALPGGLHVLPFPLAVLVYTLRSGFRAVLVDIELEAIGSTPHKAIRNLRNVLWEKYCQSREATSDDPEARILAQLIVPLEQG